MSIFKVKQWWTNEKLKSETTKEGLQNGSCVKVDKFNSHSDSDCIVVGEESQLKIYKPSPTQNASDTVLELQLENIILQIETGKFTMQAEDVQIIILQPQHYLIYNLHRKGGNSNVDDQNHTTLSIKHNFTRKASNMTCGPFGNSKARDLICIQALDGTLSFFDQDTFLFMCLFNDTIIPGPIAYIASSDMFVISKSNWVLEIYSYQQLCEFSELNARQHKKNIPQWTYNAGEEVISLQVIRTSTNFSSVIALGERHLYCFQDNGLMKFMIRFDFMPICFNAYLVGWYYEPGSRLLIMVSSEDSKLNVYEGTTLLWSCDLLDKAISVSRCFLNSLPGGIVTLSAKGIINVCYLGTQPHLNINVVSTSEAMDPREVQAELEEVEKTLESYLDHKEGANDNFSQIEEILKIKADVGQPVHNLYTTSINERDKAVQLMCPVVVTLTCEEPKLIQSIQITYDCYPPFECSESTICLDSINGTEIVEIQVFLSSASDISDTSIKILFTITESSGRIFVLSQKAILPLSLYCSPSNINSDNSIQICIVGTHPYVDLSDIFTDLPKLELPSQESLSALTLLYLTTKRSVTIRTSSQGYILEANKFTDIFPLLDNFISRLKDYHHTHMGTKSYNISFKLNMELVKQILHAFLKSVEAHAKERIKLKTMEDELNVLQRQFTVVQKRLLVQYGSLPPGDCDPLEFLMTDTHERLIKSAEEVIECRDNVCRAGCTVSSIGNLVTCIIQNTASDNFMTKLVSEMLTFSPLYEHSQEWEEAVTQAASYIINNIFKKSEKDKEKLATVIDQDVLSHVNLKKFLKQMRIVLEKIFVDASNEGTSDDGTAKEDKIIRIEELVEVL